MVRKKRIFLAGFLLIAGVFAGYVWLSQRSHGPEPFCRGKPLSYWLPFIERGDSPWINFETNGTDAIPILLKAVEMRGDVLKLAYRTVWPKMPAWVRTRWPRPVDAVKVHEHAAFLLGEVGDSDFHIHLLKTHPDPKVRASAARQLGLDYRNDKATRALAEALPQEKDPQAQVLIAEGLGYTGENALIAVPALIEGLGNKNPTVRQMMADTLIGTAFEESSITNVILAYNDSPKEKQVAIQELLAALKDKDTNIHAAATLWLWRLTGKRLPKPG